jgi:hypothetical protein
MFTKFNRVLLASGLVLTSLVGFGSSAFAQESPDSTQGQVLTVTANPYTSISWTVTSGAFTYDVDYGESLPEVSTIIGTVAYATNVIGDWAITATSTKGGVLEGVDEVSIKLPYTLKLGAGSAVTPTTDTLLLSNTVTNEPVDTTALLYMEVSDDNGTDATKIKVVAQDYKDTVTLTLTADGTTTP